MESRNREFRNKGLPPHLQGPEPERVMIVPTLKIKDKKGTPDFVTKATIAVSVAATIGIITLLINAYGGPK